MVDKPGEVPTFGGVDDGVVVHSEHVTAANALVLVSLLTHVSNDLQEARQPQAQLTWQQPPAQGSPELCLCQAWGFIGSPSPQESTLLTGNTLSGWAS